jgi:hypothetical protein
MQIRRQAHRVLPLLAAALLLAVAPGRAAEPMRCLSRDEQRAAIAAGSAVPLASVMQTLQLAPREVVRARLCHGSGQASEPTADHLIYLLTLLGRDGKVRRTTVDAATGTQVGER